MSRPRRPAGIVAAPAAQNSSPYPAKHRGSFDHRLAGIPSGQLKPGDRLSSGAGAGRSFQASRITVAKAVLELQRLEHPELPIRKVLAPIKLVVRRSCGAHLGAPQP